MKKFWKMMILCAAALVFATGCGGGAIGGFDYASAGQNSDSTLRITGAWTKTGIGTHFHSGPDAGPVIMYSVEGCMQYVRTTKDFYYLLAERFEHRDDHTSLIRIRPDAKWHDGEPVVAMDILSYYTMCVTDLSKYTLNMEVVDDNGNGKTDDDLTLKLYWKPWKEPTAYAKDMLLAMDTKNGSIPYHVFKSYIDRSLGLIYNGPDGSTPNQVVTEASDGQGETRLGRHINSVSAALGEIYNEFRAFVFANGDSTQYLGTGPYKVQTVTENQMILVKNDDYYFADQIGFERIMATQYSNDNQRFADMKAGKLDYVDGVLPKDINESILSKNRNMVSYKYYDQGAIGLYYNMEKGLWESEQVRLAFQYLFDRDAIREAVVPYGVTSYKPMMMISPIEARQYMSEEAYSLIANYRLDLAEAERLLREAGWTKPNGSWRDENGTPVSITIGYENNTTFLKCAQIVKADLEKFGISVTLKSGSDWGTWFSTASSPNSIYDCVIAFTELNTFGTHPAGAMKHFFDILQAHVLHLETDEATGKFSLEIDLLSQADKTQMLGKTNCYSLYQRLYLYEGTELENYVDSIVLGFSKLNYGVQFFENVTGSYFDASRVGGLPSADLMAETRNLEILPDYFEENYAKYAILNAYFTQAAPVATGQLYAKK